MTVCIILKHLSTWFGCYSGDTKQLIYAFSVQIWQPKYTTNTFNFHLTTTYTKQDVVVLYYRQ